ncbi:hypothetical protein ACKLNO_01255 [Neisseriaceae bacterium B1]
MKLLSTNQGNTALSHYRITRHEHGYRLCLYKTNFKDWMHEDIGFDTDLQRIIASAFALQTQYGTSLPIVLLYDSSMQFQAQDVAAVASSHADTAATSCAVNADPHG